ncbi:unnamed protein product, partial [Rotaria magnacalcarata]
MIEEPWDDAFFAECAA